MSRVYGRDPEPDPRPLLEAKWGRVWDEAEFLAEFVPHGYMLPFVISSRKSDMVRGCARSDGVFYFDWKADRRTTD